MCMREAVQFWFLLVGRNPTLNAFGKEGIRWLMKLISSKEKIGFRYGWIQGIQWYFCGSVSLLCFALLFSAVVLFRIAFPLHWKLWPAIYSHQSVVERGGFLPIILQHHLWLDYLWSLLVWRAITVVGGGGWGQLWALWLFLGQSSLKHMKWDWGGVVPKGTWCSSPKRGN